MLATDAIIKSGIKLDPKLGPAILMSQIDHQQTLSWGSKGAGYRAAQTALLKQGKYMESFNIEAKAIQETFGDKYDRQIAEARQYLADLISSGELK
jgi:hypothetical protein